MAKRPAPIRLAPLILLHLLERNAKRVTQLLLAQAEYQSAHAGRRAPTCLSVDFGAFSPSSFFNRLVQISCGSLTSAVEECADAESAHNWLRSTFRLRDHVRIDAFASIYALANTVIVIS